MANCIPRVPESCTINKRVSLTWKKSDRHQNPIIHVPSMILRMLLSSFQSNFNLLRVNILKIYKEVPASSALQGPFYSYSMGWPFIHHWLFATPWTVAHQAPQSMEFSRQEYWSGLPFPSPEDIPDPRIEPASTLPPALAGGFLPLSHLGSYSLCLIPNSSGLVNQQNH